ncbi:helix-turn-helix domain-containing protein [Xanthobacter sp. YC-JY1]|nr:helix-turn-helix domain-containing protein [Xanthobacter sp. YC-JY1]
MPAAAGPSGKEFAVLALLVRHHGCLVAHRQFLAAVWGRLM